MLILTSGESSVVVSPEHGAGLTGWMRGRTSMLRRALPQTAVGADPHAMGCFPLVPYGNRICHGRFRWRGIDYTLARNFGDQPHTIHGIGWQRAWTVEQAGSRSVTLSLDHRGDASWPFAFLAGITYTLTDDTLTIAMQVTNRHGAPAPVGLGIHPHFPKANQPFLRFDAAAGWENGPDALPSRQERLKCDWLHTEARAVASSRLDNCFVGWDRTADILAGPASLRIETSEVFRQLQVFTPSWADFFCVEPVSHIPDAVNRPDLPPEQAMHVLEPDARLDGTIRLVPTG